ncbi:M24 family metallopeptidase [Lactococcus insecticola]|uniref:Xaa-Pro aminopeptidase n=1 Tax=Pseudolactococcus insecticola TaxID=2709158 RepID=A0A6A0B5Q8_9LACT|nr:Xaa-Pro peptidase family protein [Lactococcus insecticola]GFH39624.1 Xaa-Pro aminopeptidase [Lactococcus insecticola]
MTRLSTFRERLVTADLDGIIVTNLKNIYYLSGFWGTAGTVFITRQAQYLLVDARYILAARDVADEHFEILETRDAVSEIAKLVKKENLTKIGFEDDLSYAGYQAMSEVLATVELNSLSQFTEIQRQIKSSDEVKIIQKACQISDQAFRDMLKFIEPGKTELDVANFLDFKMRELGASGISFDTIVASGKRSSLPHGRASHKPIAFGDIVTVDFGCYYDHYASDMTRTFFVGQADEQLRDIYNTVLSANQAVIDATKAGMTYGDYDKTARDVIDSAGFGAQFSHGIGHGLGLDVHEMPYFPRASETHLQENMVITDEPGIYLENVGGVRIEDDLLVTKEGVQVLTLAPKELIII